MTMNIFFTKNFLDFIKFTWIDIKFLILQRKNNIITFYEFFMFLCLKLISNIYYMFYSRYKIKIHDKSNYHDIGILKKSDIKSNISVIIPIYINNVHDIIQLKDLIDSICKNISTLITIVNDGSPLYILDNIINLSKKYENITLLSIYPNSGPAKARNIGLDYAYKNNIETICFTDLDCLLTKDYIKNVIESDINNALLCGITYSYGDTIFDKFHDFYGTLNCRLFFNYKVLYAPTCNLAIKGKELIKKLRFDDDFKNAAFEDVEFCLRTRFNEKIDIIHIKNMIMLHNFNYKKNIFLNMISFCKKFIKYAKNEQLLINKFKSYPFLYDQSFPVSSKTNEILYIK